jgi:hypothetical protein
VNPIERFNTIGCNYIFEWLNIAGDLDMKKIAVLNPDVKGDSADNLEGILDQFAQAGLLVQGCTVVYEGDAIVFYAPDATTPIEELVQDMMSSINDATARAGMAPAERDAFAAPIEGAAAQLRLLTAQLAALQARLEAGLQLEQSSLMS